MLALCVYWRRQACRAIRRKRRGTRQSGAAARGWRPMLTANPLRTRSGILFLFIGVVAVGLLLFGFQQRAQPRDVDLSTLLADLRTDIAHHNVDTLIVNSGVLELDR